MIAIKLTKGKVTLIDKKDFMKLSQKDYYFNGKGYAARGQRIGPRKFNKTLCIYMHREILNAPEGVEVDHINGNKLDNRRFNLRLAFLIPRWLQLWLTIFGSRIFRMILLCLISPMQFEVRQVLHAS